VFYAASTLHLVAIARVERIEWIQKMPNKQFGSVSIDYGLKELRFDLAAYRSPPKPLITMVDWSGK
jgi:hypothetical protein